MSMITIRTNNPTETLDDLRALATELRQAESDCVDNWQDTKAGFWWKEAAQQIERTETHLQKVWGKA